MSRLVVRIMLVGALAAGCGSGALPSPAPPARVSGPELYGAGLFSTGRWDFFLAWTPDQRRVVFGRADDAFEQYDLYETRLGADGRWSAPVKPRFAERWSNADAHIAPDGRALYFISNRPPEGDGAARASYDIWVTRLGPAGEWGDAEALPAPVNDPERDEWCPAVAANGNLYFGGDRPGGRGGSDLWVARLVEGVYQPPENLGDAINTPAHELEPWIAPDESYLILSGLRRADRVGRYDLYLSRRVGDTWEQARLLDGRINTLESEFNHSVSPDGRWLYFSSTRGFSGEVGERFDVPRDDASIRGIGNGLGDIYRVPMTTLGL